MKSEEIVFLVFPNRIVVCESCTSSLGENPETRDLYEYARIVKYCQPTNLWETHYEYTGDIEWSKYAEWLRPEHKEEILRFAERMRADNSEAIAKAKAEEQHNRRLFPGSI